jgi:hypothetical protein
MRTHFRSRSTLLAAMAMTALDVINAAPAQAITCYSSVTSTTPWYSGPSASSRYDSKFAAGPAAVPQPVLDTYVPQGLATWGNWDGTGANLIVYTAYAENSTRALVQGINPATGARTRAAYIPYSHVGGIAFSNGFAWIAGGGKLSSYSIPALRGAFKGTSGASIQPRWTRSNVYGTSFLAASSGYLFAGRFNDRTRDIMHRYRIEATGTLTMIAGSIQVPMKTQGLAITSTHYFFSTSYGEPNRSNLYVVRRGYTIDSTRASCFRAPSMSEGLAIYNGRLYVLYESGAHLYLVGTDPLNVIKRLHSAPLSVLTPLAP